MRQNFPSIPDKELAILKEVITSYRNIAIFTHSEPDPDAISSALTLQELCKRLGVDSEIFYQGEITRSDNQSLINYSSVPFKRLENFSLDEADGIATVDCQDGMGNLTEKIKNRVNFSIDHHPVVSNNTPLNIVLPEMGACATIVMHYFLSFGFQLNEVLASNHICALRTETKDFFRKATLLDEEIYKYVIAESDLKKIAEILNSKRPADYFKLLKKGIENSSLKDGIIVSNLGTIDNLHFIHEIADKLINIEGSHISIVAAVDKSTSIGRICARNEDSNINIGEVTKQAMKLLAQSGHPESSGGGHFTMAAGKFTCSANQAIQAFLKELDRHPKSNL